MNNWTKALTIPALWVCLCLSSLAGCATSGQTTAIAAPEVAAPEASGTTEWARMADDTLVDVYVQRNGALVKGKAVAPKGAPVKVGNVTTK